MGNPICLVVGYGPGVGHGLATAFAIRVGLVSIMGEVAAGSAFDPEKIGAAFLKMTQHPVEGYETEMLFTGA